MSATTSRRWPTTILPLVLILWLAGQIAVAWFLLTETPTTRGWGSHGFSLSSDRQTAIASLHDHVRHDMVFEQHLGIARFSFRHWSETTYLTVRRSKRTLRPSWRPVTKEPCSENPATTSFSGTLRCPQVVVESLWPQSPLALTIRSTSFGLRYPS
jgi:hypothetical protein